MSDDPTGDRLADHRRLASDCLSGRLPYDNLLKIQSFTWLKSRNICDQCPNGTPREILCCLLLNKRYQFIEEEGNVKKHIIDHLIDVETPYIVTTHNVKYTIVDWLWKNRLPDDKMMYDYLDQKMT